MITCETLIRCPLFKVGSIIDISIGKQQPQYTLLQIGSQALTLQMPDCLNNYY